MCKNSRGAKIHQARCQFAPDTQNFVGTVANREAKELQREELQKAKPKVTCDNEKLDNVHRFKYLGSVFTSNGNQMRDIRIRSAMAKSRCGDLRHVLGADAIPIPLRISIYKAAVCSILCYGSEAWNLTTETMVKINGTNARCLSHITRKTAHEEASPRTRTFDLLHAIRKCRYSWLGHILRMGDKRLVKHAARAQHAMNLPGNLFMDAPPHNSFEELVKMAESRKLWKAYWIDKGAFDAFDPTAT